MEDYFTWFLKTGQIWGASGIRLCPETTNMFR